MTQLHHFVSGYGLHKFALTKMKIVFNVRLNLQWNFQASFFHTQIICQALIIIYTLYSASAFHVRNALKQSNLHLFNQFHPLQLGLQRWEVMRSCSLLLHIDPRPPLQLVKAAMLSPLHDRTHVTLFPWSLADACLVHLSLIVLDIFYLGLFLYNWSYKMYPIVKHISKR